MDEHEQRCEALLAAFREGDELDDASVDRLAGRLAGNLDADPVWAGPDVLEVPQAVAKPRWKAVVAIAVGLAAALLLWVTSRSSQSVLVDDAASRAAEFSASPSTADGTARPRTPRSSPRLRAKSAGRVDETPPKSEQPEATLSNLPAPSATLVPTGSDKPDQPRLPQKRTRGPRAESKPSSPHGEATAPVREPAVVPSSLAEEAKLLQRADEALRHGRSADAWAELKTYPKRFPDASLAREAQALTVVAGCQLGRPDAAAAAERFLHRSPQASVRRRIEAACP